MRSCRRTAVCLCAWRVAHCCSLYTSRAVTERCDYACDGYRRYCLSQWCDGQQYCVDGTDEADCDDTGIWNFDVHVNYIVIKIMTKFVCRTQVFFRQKYLPEVMEAFTACCGVNGSLGHHHIVTSSSAFVFEVSGPPFLSQTWAARKTAAVPLASAPSSPRCSCCWCWRSPLSSSWRCCAIDVARDAKRRRDDVRRTRRRQRMLARACRRFRRRVSRHCLAAARTVRRSHHPLRSVKLCSFLVQFIPM